MATYAIGDVQGCFNSLQQLLNTISFSQHDRLWFVGDLVNRGPHSLETLRFIKSLEEQATVVLGNHDIHLIAVAEGVEPLKRRDTIEEVLHASDGAELIDWLRHRPLMHVNENYAMVHAGLLPSWDVQRALALAHEVETALRDKKYKKFLAKLYGNKPTRWREDLKGFSRLRVIVNAMTRLRFCTPDGDMQFDSKGPPEKAPPGYLPWFDVPQRANSNATIVCGHWSAMGLRIKESIVALDSGCVWGEKLSAIRLEDRKIFQVRCQDPASPVH